MRIPLKIVTEHIKPPIPVSWWDWRAYVQGREEDRSAYGWGSSEDEAIADLMESLEDEPC